MVSTTIAAEVTSVLREAVTGVENQGRALGTSMLHLVPPAQVLGWMASALDSAASILGPDSVQSHPGNGRVPGDFVVVDRSLTQC